jgi:exopolysaccharide biosynthesis protein
MTRGRGFRTIVATAAIVGVVGVASSIAMKPSMITAGATGEKGLNIYKISGGQYGVFTVIHVLTFSGSLYAVKIGLAHHAIDGGVETPSSMCQSTAGCVAAVNGDFFDLTHQGKSDPGDGVGGIIQNCVLLHTPEVAHQQTNLDGQSVSDGLNWSSTIDVNGTNVPITAINQELPMRYLNVNLPLAGTLLFTTPYALRTPSAVGRVTYEFTQVKGSTTSTTTTTTPTTTTTTPTTTSTTTPTTTSTTNPTTTTTTSTTDNSISPTTINTTAVLELVAQTAREVKVTAGRVDISAPTGTVLATLQVGNTVTMTTTSTAGCDNIGGHPILLNHGAVVPIDHADTHMFKPYARTVIGWTASGETVIMTIDGKDGVSGATAHQLVRLLESLNVVTALDLDGGISTTLFAKGRVLDIPSRGTERPVSTSLLVVQNH